VGTAVSCLLALLAPASRPIDSAGGELPPRVRRIVLHVLGGPSYQRPERRFVFFSPRDTQALWKTRFGAHWIVWTDGSVWPRHTAAGPAVSWTPGTGAAASPPERRRIAEQAVPVYGHLYRGNSHTLGVEVAHSGRHDDPFPPAQMRSLAWLLKTLIDMSGGRLSESSVFGHKDLDQRPAYVSARCERPGCPVFVDGEGRPFRRRVDPPEALFVQLERAGLRIPRPREGDAELLRAEELPPDARPAVARP